MLKNPLQIYNDVTECIGHTPMIKLNNLPNENEIKCQIYAKCDFLSIGGSSKDRIGLSMIVEAEKRGAIKPGDTIVEATSGNTGIGLALTAIVRGYKVIITIPDKMSDEKINILKALGAQVIKTPTVDHHHPDSYTSVAKRISAQPNHYFIGQYDNLDNRLAHKETTAVEIWEQMKGEIDYIFISAGTAGTISGVGMEIHRKDPNVKIIGIDPHGSIMARPEELNKITSLYKIEGIGQSFIPNNMEYKEIHDWIKIDDIESFNFARNLIEKEGLLVGGSSGSVIAGAFRYLKEKNLHQKESLKCVVFLPDCVRNYMSKFLDDNWMVGNGFYPVSKLEDPKHPLAHFTIFDLKNLQPISYYDARLTVNDCFDLFKKGHVMIPIRSSGQILGVVTESSLSNFIFEKNLSGMSSASHCIQKNYLTVSDNTSLSVISKILRNNLAVLVLTYSEEKKIRTIYVITQKEILEKLYEGMKEII